MMQNAEVPPFVDAMEMPQNELREVVQIDPPVPINVTPVVPPHPLHELNNYGLCAVRTSAIDFGTRDFYKMISPDFVRGKIPKILLPAMCYRIV